MLITCLLLVLEVWDGKPTSRKSWAGNIFICFSINGDCIVHLLLSINVRKSMHTVMFCAVGSLPVFIILREYSKIRCKYAFLKNTDHYNRLVINFGVSTGILDPMK